jgi:hypothetical protein
MPLDSKKRTETMTKLTYKAGHFLPATLRVAGIDAVALGAAALSLGWGGVGLNQKGLGRFVHLDRRADPAVWTY